MARRRGSRKPSRDRGRDYYEGLPTDAAYKKTAHQRAVHGSIRRWIIRIGVLAVLGLLVWLLHDDVARYARVQAYDTSEGFREGADHIREGRDRRAGVDWVEGD
jgi:hypothetical protein